jgi:hypothetical protein
MTASRSFWVPAILGGLVAASLPGNAAAAPSGKPVYADPAHVDDDFPFQGEYAGEVSHDGTATAVGVQVIALGDGRFDLVAYPGGLPGAGWMPPEKARGTGERVGTGAEAFVKLTGTDWAGTSRQGEIRGGRLVVQAADGSTIASLPKVERTSPTLGAAPPEGAVVVFDGSGVEGLHDGRLTDDGLLMEGVTTKDGFSDARWHIEFRLPYQPHDRGQGRGNSGAYVQGAYEVQMLDSFGLDGLNNECGGIYSVAAPAVNMCLPPLAWQTYDIAFTAPRFENGAKVANARMTVRHNGVVIHDDVEVPKITPGGPQKDERPTGPLHLQNHGNPVRYRNIWVLPKS